jgi:hypothetical protein
MVFGYWPVSLAGCGSDSKFKWGGVILPTEWLNSQSKKLPFVIRKLADYRMVPSSTCTTHTFEQLISDCLQLLNHHPAGTLMYDLACLCPDDIDVILNLVRLDLSQPHEHKPFQESDIDLAPSVYENLQADLRAQMSIVPPEEYSRFWLELTKRWLLTCPIDPEYYLEDETGKELYCQKLRSELVERILNIN